MKTASIATLVLAALCALATAPQLTYAQENVLFAAGSTAADKTAAPNFIPGVGAPEGLDGSTAGSGKGDNSLPSTVGPAKMDGKKDDGASKAKAETTPVAKTTMPSPAPSKTSSANAAVGVGAAVVMSISATVATML